MENINSIIESINNSSSFEELKKLNILPEPDFDDGYYFVSYSHKDYKKVLIDIIKYKENGIKIWYDRGLEVGKSWLEDVCRKIDSFNCKGVIAYVSNNFVVSSACKKEMEQVGESNKSLMVIDINQDLKVEEIGCYGLLKYEDSIVNKIDLINMLPKPELYEFDIDRNFLFGKYAILVKVNDKNIEIAKIPTYCTMYGKKYRVRVIGNNAFLNCVNLREVYLPDKWFAVMEDAFCNCYSLQKVEVGKLSKILGIISLGYLRSCFTNCISLKDLNFLRTNGKIYRGLGMIACSNTFRDCTSLENICITKPYAFIEGGFMDCTGLKRVEFFGFVPGVSGYQFANCINLEEVIFNKAKEFSAIQKYAFYACEKIKKLDLPDTTKAIGDMAFAYMKSLEEIRMSKKLSFLALSAFKGCEKLKSLYLPKSMRFINISEKNDTFEKVIIASKKIKFLNGVIRIEIKMIDIFKKAKEIYCIKNAKYNFLGYKKIESDIIGFDKYIVENNYEQD